MPRERVLSPRQEKHISVIYLTAVTTPPDPPYHNAITQEKLGIQYGCSRSRISLAVRNGAEMILSEAGISPNDTRVYVVNKAVDASLDPDLALLMVRYVLWRRYQSRQGGFSAPWKHELPTIRALYTVQ